MTAKSLSTVLLRVLGLWLILDAFFRISELLVSGWMGRGASASAGWTSYPPLASPVSTSDLYLNDTYYVISHLSPTFVSPGLKLLVGLLLFFAARRFARILSSGLEENV
jgi:heme/copper-type cytochrome/quinol oxidase subunit 1